uniref:Uncharacterized protein n=1 Tax=Rhipicephalus zambeziensis TaxID=60191 RepID=A0A224Y9W5_9ACAR
MNAASVHPHLKTASAHAHVSSLMCDLVPVKCVCCEYESVYLRVGMSTYAPSYMFDYPKEVPKTTIVTGSKFVPSVEWNAASDCNTNGPVCLGKLPVLHCSSCVRPGKHAFMMLKHDTVAHFGYAILQTVALFTFFL